MTCDCVAKPPNEVWAEYRSYLVLSGTVIPHDDTLPLVNEGVEILRATIVPNYSGSRLVVSASIPVAAENVDGGAVAALFRGSEVLQARAAWIRADAYPGDMGIELKAMVMANSQASTDFAVRVGNRSVYTSYVNGYAGGRLFGGASYAWLHVREIPPLP
jgi:hypothetical protein